MFEGAVVSHSGWQPIQQDLERGCGRYCIECGEEGFHGIFTVGYGRKWLGLRKTVDFVNFTCKECWDELRPHYDYSEAIHE